MKFEIPVCHALAFASPPAWGAWIEILQKRAGPAGFLSPPAWGAWIEMFSGPIVFRSFSGRPPHGGRGLKCKQEGSPTLPPKVAPRMGGVD